jgi:hypothetical protein
MSAIKTDLPTKIKSAINGTITPWSTVYTNLDKTPKQLMDIIADHNIDISGVYVDGKQYNMSDVAYYAPGSSQSFLYALYGLFVTCTTGKSDPHLEQYIKSEWIPWLLQASILNEPAFLYVCKRSLTDVAQFILHLIEASAHYQVFNIVNSDGDSALHIAVRKKQWQWAQLLIKNKSCPYLKNKAGHSPMMLVAPHFEQIEMFKVKPEHYWYSELHDAIVHGKNHPGWIRTLAELGADINQDELIDSPPESLQILATAGLDPNIGRIPPSNEQRRILYLYGREPCNWHNVTEIFKADKDIVQELFALHYYSECTEQMKQNILSRRAIDKKTIKLKKRILQKYAI